MRVVVLTNNGSLFGKQILNELMHRETNVTGVVVIKQPLKYHWGLFKYVRRRVGLFDALYFSLRRFTAQLTAGEPDFWNGRHFVGRYEDMGVPVRYTHGTTTQETLKIITDLAPDVLILGQTGIIKSALLKIPTIGTLNAHPGILPHYRGIDCAKWAIYNNEFDKIGSSVHWVNSGVDTGNIIVAEVYQVTGNETIDTLDDHLYELGISLLVDVVMAIGRGEVPRGILQRREEGRQYFKMPRRTEVVVKRKLKEFCLQGNLANLSRDSQAQCKG